MSVWNVIINRFGEDVETYAYDMDNFKAEVEVAVNKMFYMWVFGFEGMVQIKAPDRVQQEYSNMIVRAYDRILEKSEAVSK